jgi:hypothetical protein
MPFEDPCRKLIDTIYNIPASNDFDGRTEFLRDISFNGSRSNNKQTDLSNMVYSLKDAYGPQGERWLYRLIENAKAAAKGAAQLRSDLAGIKQEFILAAWKAASPNSAVLGQLHFFDLRQMVALCLGHLPPGGGGLWGFAIPGASPVILKNFCQSLPLRGEQMLRVWARDQIVLRTHLSIVSPYTQASSAIERFAQIKLQIDRKHIAWSLNIEVENDVETIWSAAQADFGKPANRYLILIFGIPLGLKIPPDIVLLQSPTFSRSDIESWIAEMARVVEWDYTWVERWTEVIFNGSLSGGKLSPDLLYANLDTFHKRVHDLRDNNEAIEQALIDYENGGM